MWAGEGHFILWPTNDSFQSCFNLKNVHFPSWRWRELEECWRFLILCSLKNGFGFRGHFYELFRVLISILAIRLVGACYLWQCRWRGYSIATALISSQALYYYSLHLLMRYLFVAGFTFDGMILQRPLLANWPRCKVCKVKLWKVTAISSSCTSTRTYLRHSPPA